MSALLESITYIIMHINQPMVTFDSWYDDMAVLLVILYNTISI